MRSSRWSEPATSPPSQEAEDADQDALRAASTHLVDFRGGA
jgi:hypothetical protein